MFLDLRGKSVFVLADTQEFISHNHFDKSINRDLLSLKFPLRLHKNQVVQKESLNKFTAVLDSKILGLNAFFYSIYIVLS